MYDLPAYGHLVQALPFDHNLSCATRRTFASGSILPAGHAGKKKKKTPGAWNKVTGYWARDMSEIDSWDWLLGKFTGNHGFYHQIWMFSVNVPIIQHLEWWFHEHLVWNKRSEKCQRKPTPAPPKGAGVTGVAITGLQFKLQRVSELPRRCLEVDMSLTILGGWICVF